MADKHPEWPKPGEHLFTEWQANTGMPKPTQWRHCIHPDCKHVEYRDAPLG